MTKPGKPTNAQVGLCTTCRFMRVIRSDRGSTFYLCEWSEKDPSFPKYPRLPVLQCGAYKPIEEKEKGTADGS